MFQTKSQTGNNFFGQLKGFVILATQNDTLVTMTDPKIPGALPLISPTTLQQGQLLVQPIQFFDANGVRVQSSKPIAVFHQDRAPFLDNHPGNNNDPMHLEHHPLPMAGVDFIVTHWARQRQQDTVRVLSSQDDTLVTVERSDGIRIERLMQAGDHLDFRFQIDGTARIRSSRPVSVVQMKAPGVTVAYDSGVSASAQIFPEGDSEAVEVAPVSLYNTSYRVFAPTGYTVGQFLRIVAPDADATISLDGSAVTSAPTPLSGGGKLHILPVSPGEHVVSADRPIQVYAEGYQKTTTGTSMYGYPGGFVVRAAGELNVSILKVAPSATDPNEVVALTAFVNNGSFTDLSNVRVRFIVGDPAENGRPIGPDQIVPSLPAGTSAVLTVEFATPNPGIHTLAVAVDPLNVVGESLEGDNVQKATLRVSSLGLVVAQASTDRFQYFAQENGTLAGLLSNLGTADLTNLTIRGSIETEAGVEVLDLGTQPLGLLKPIPPALAGWRYVARAEFAPTRPLVTDALLRTSLDFRKLLDSVGDASALDVASIRVFEETPQGAVERPSVFIPAETFNALAAPAGQVEWLTYGPKAAGSTTSYLVFFDSAANGPKQDVARPKEWLFVPAQINPIVQIPPVIGFGDTPENQYLFAFESGRDGTLGPFVGVGRDLIFPEAMTFSHRYTFWRRIRHRDLDRDGFADVSFNTTAADEFTWSYSLQAPGSLFGPEVPVYQDSSISSGLVFGTHEIGDFDGDGLPDVIVPMQNPAAIGFAPGFGIMRGRPDAQFDAPEFVDPVTLQQFVAVADFNEDGIEDLARQFGGTVLILLGGSPVAFTVSQSVFVGGGILDIRVADVNGDGHDDIVTRASFPNKVIILYGNGNGTVQPPVQITFTEDPTEGGGFLSLFLLMVHPFDFDRDGNADLLMQSVTSLAAAKVNFFLARGNGDGTFKPVVKVGGFGDELVNPSGGVFFAGPEHRQIAIPGTDRAIASLAALLSFPFNTGDLLAGPYRGRIDVLDSAGNLLATATDDFEILPTVDGGVAADIAADKLSYLPGDLARLGSKATNLGENVTLQNLTATVKVLDPGAVEMLSKDHAIATLTPRQLVTFDTFFDIAARPPGLYTATLSVADGASVLATDQTAFVIEEVFKLAGKVTVDKFQIVAGTPLDVSVSVTNDGNVAVTGATLEVLFVESTTQAVVTTLTTPLDLSPGQTFADVFAGVSTAGLNPVGHLVVMRALVPGSDPVPIDSTSFIVLPCPFLEFAIFADELAELVGTSLTDFQDPPLPLSGPDGHVGSNGDVVLKGTSTVDGAITAAGQIKELGTPTVTGTKTAGADPIPLPSIDAQVAFAATANDNGTIPQTAAGKTALSGTKLSVAANDTLVLQAGTYYLTDVSIRGTLTLEGPAIFAVDGAVSIANSAIVNSLEEESLLAILVKGPGKRFSAAGQSKTYALVYGPDIEADIGGAAELFGAVVAGTVRLDGGAKVHATPGIKNFCGLISGGSAP